MVVRGQVIAGQFGKILIRQKAGAACEIGELLIAESPKEKLLFEVADLSFGSQISQANRELISGLNLEEEVPINFFEPELRSYTTATLKNLLTIRGTTASLAKGMPEIFSAVREVTPEDLQFIIKPKCPLFFGHLRSGSKSLAVPLALRGDEVLAHHILIAATTGRGKSNLTSCMLWDVAGKSYCGMLVLDPHDEYYGRNGFGLKDHPAKQVRYYSPRSPPPGATTLVIQLSILRPWHFNGVVSWSDPQREALVAYYRKYSHEWIIALLQEKPLDFKFNEGTMAVVRRRISQLLDVEYTNGMLSASGIFSPQAGMTTITDICNALENANIVLLDTSSFSGSQEILIGSLIASEIFSRYRRYQYLGTLREKPVISIILEEAPRVLGKEVLEQGQNIFSQIAREGRKFKVGLIAITQLPSLIPREILANMNTKIILGIEMKPERQAIIESAAQDLSDADRMIASLDKGEAIVTSTFARFATPIKIPLFSEWAATNTIATPSSNFAGVGRTDE
ncbi:MAG TPA: ATP-binding protein [Candidatus Nanoarchaeia archaeon]|nr:ATP-binding protein [Candidatus Nanoarchaeia archaeon]